MLRSVVRAHPELSTSLSGPAAVAPLLQPRVRAGLLRHRFADDVGSLPRMPPGEEQREDEQDGEWNEDQADEWIHDAPFICATCMVPVSPRPERWSIEEVEKKKNHTSNAANTSTTARITIRSAMVTVGATPLYSGRSPRMLRNQVTCLRTVGEAPTRLSYRAPSARKRRRSRKQTIPNTIATTAIPVIDAWL